MSNTLGFGENMPSQGSMYLRVKEKGDMIQFRIAQNPTYVGKHFMQKEQGWNVFGCPRINSQEKCDYCDMYFKGMAEVKKLQGGRKDSELEKEELKKIEDLRADVRQYGCSITFYFPVLNRETHKMGILQTTQGVRNKINEFYENGTNIVSKDFVLRNTGKVGKDRYSVTVVDSADTAPFTPEDSAEYGKAQDYDRNEINDGLSQQDEIE